MPKNKLKSRLSPCSRIEVEVERNTLTSGERVLRGRRRGANESSRTQGNCGSSEGRVRSGHCVVVDTHQVLHLTPSALFRSEKDPRSPKLLPCPPAVSSAAERHFLVAGVPTPTTPVFPSRHRRVRPLLRTAAATPGKSPRGVSTRCCTRPGPVRALSHPLPRRQAAVPRRRPPARPWTANGAARARKSSRFECRCVAGRDHDRPPPLTKRKLCGGRPSGPSGFSGRTTGDARCWQPAAAPRHAPETAAALPDPCAHPRSARWP
mmetsp:Transcript_5054/g.12776  ORF Transcript_5054/g.12776 Transcript_5054/m.12776 type:complete len:264 (-) Transcript_5054:1985-2776(-)